MAAVVPPSAPAPARFGLHYKWIALSNTTLGMLMATLNASIVLIALPAIFNGVSRPVPPAG